MRLVSQRFGKTPDELRELARDTFIGVTEDIEAIEGWDSVSTMDRMYRWPDEDSSCVCVMPRCSFRRHDPVDMWWHVHHTGHPSIFAESEHMGVEGE